MTGIVQVNQHIHEAIVVVLVERPVLVHRKGCPVSAACSAACCDAARTFRTDQVWTSRRPTRAW
jgi:hypothetical protein